MDGHPHFLPDSSSFRFFETTANLWKQAYNVLTIMLSIERGDNGLMDKFNASNNGCRDMIKSTILNLHNVSSHSHSPDLET